LQHSQPASGSLYRCHQRGRDCGCRDQEWDHTRARGGGQQPGGEDHCLGQHAVRIGAEPAEHAEVLDQHPVGEAKADHGADDRTDDVATSGQQAGASGGQHHDRDQVDGEAVRGHQGGKPADQVMQGSRLAHPGHRGDG